MKGYDQRSIIVACALGYLASGLALGCSGGRDVSEIAATIEQPGTLQIPLTASAPSGQAYHLRNAIFDISNPFTSPPIELALPGDEDELQVTLPPSVLDFDYSISLRDGWTLTQTLPDGTEQPVEATLTSFIPLNFTIKPQRVTPIAFDFRVGSHIITTGDGKLVVSVAVDDTLIDDFEDGDSLLVAAAGRNGNWFTFNDGSGIQLPAPGSETLPEVVDASANFVLHVTGRDFSPNRQQPDGSFPFFGAAVAASLSNDPTTGRVMPYDASSYSGIRFNFRMAFPQSTPVQLAFLVGTSATTPVEDGGTCTANCYDDFGFVGSVPFSPLYFSGGFTWDQLVQQGFGTQVTFDPATILFIKWIVSFPDAGQSSAADRFDFQLDDLAFLSDDPDLPVNTTTLAPPPESVPPFSTPLAPTQSWEQVSGNPVTSSRLR